MLQSMTKQSWQLLKSIFLTTLKCIGHQIQPKNTYKPLSLNDKLLSKICTLTLIKGVCYSIGYQV